MSTSTVAVHGRSGVPAPRLQPPLSLYVHLPWCVRKCPYCDFNSHQAGAEVPEQAYADALLRDLELSVPSVWGRRVQSVFFGGGTPSLFSAESIERLLAGIRALLPLTPDCEVTLEANPGTAEAHKFAAFRAAGVNRLSIGVQSFHARHLEQLGRIHDDREARRAIELAQRSFDEINLDLMYALPGQTLEEALADAAEAVAYQTSHLSFYHLTIEPNTLFERHPPSVPDPDSAAAIEDQIRQVLLHAGFEHYETSAYSRPGHRCRHNLNYWQFGDYLGIGAGAHSKVSFHDRIVRQARTRQPREYMKRVAAGAPVLEERTLGRGDAIFEFMMNALRLVDGFPVALFEERTGLPLTMAGSRLDRAEARQLIERSAGAIRPTELGQRFLNDLLQLFLPS